MIFRSPIYLVFALLLIFSTNKGSAQEKTILKEGDFLFQQISCGPLCDAILAVTSGYQGQKFNHMGMVILQQDSLMIVEAIGKDVHLSSISDFLKRSANPVYTGRLKQEYQRLIPAAAHFSLDQLGTPYDDAFLYQNGKYYCSELIYDAFLSANRGEPVFELQPMTYKVPGSNSFFPVWKDYFDNLKQPVPEGLPGCNPGGISLSDKIDMAGRYQP
ncbi:YiiX/YebB-like N1pC/P60 family cysteine hydrolase [Pedobacter antarcticus]|uniref:YiiX/YebB-like N1pC/P60 family cysteine hydrolase n=1 Tax=Pedobacter antarcticus TaxID=34086 RepID=UPI00088029D0|nr:YiiX/YebB-like N1pC/P60 family cysteine hydrolase [Pedobacter antarcticus]SDL74570.1 Permuted papain-like amidase enzyme, YaeF/YiiX, C92 family [Pedobacter antarcticus]